MSDSTEDVAFMSLDSNQIDRLRPHGTVLEVPEGDLLFREGDTNLDLFVVIEGEFVLSQLHTQTEQDIELGTAPPGTFIGEYNVLTGEATFIHARAAVRSKVLAVSEPALRELMATDNDLGDLLFAAFVARREMIIGSDTVTTLTIVGSRHTSRTLDLVGYARRMRVAHRWVDPEDDPSLYDTLVSAGISRAELPVAVTATAMLRRPTIEVLAGHLGSLYHPTSLHIHDVVVVGAGPAGLAAAVYGASPTARLPAARL
jgi:thioredoxin reductase (NADPH)